MLPLTLFRSDHPGRNNDPPYPDFSGAMVDDYVQSTSDWITLAGAAPRFRDPCPVPGASHRS
jgi:hypothetical protein